MRKVVVVLGVHRSGTSLTSEILSALGLSLGSELIPGRGDNPRGFFENRPIIEQTRAIEQRLHINPFRDLALFEHYDDLVSAEKRREDVSRLADILEQEMSYDTATFAFKDPRTVQLLSLWTDVFKKLKVQPVYVLALRHPRGVASSMARRGHFAETFGEVVWCAHMHAALERLNAGPGIIVHYERWMSDPWAQARHLIEQLSAKGVDLDANAETKVPALVAPGNGSRVSERSARFSPAGELYAQLTAFGDGEAGLRDLQRTVTNVGTSLEALAPATEELRHQAKKRREQQKRDQEQLKQAEDKAARNALAPSDSGKVHPAHEIEPRPRDSETVDFPNLQSFPAGETPGRPLKICIATEDIVGPIRNGGIGTTYTHLSYMLAEAGHSVSIFYLRGSHSENGPIERWVDHYREKGVRFVPINPDQGSAESVAPRWINPMVALYAALKEEHFDLVHASEWRGLAYLSMQAKRLGLAFQATTFCIKTSSPWLWNREYGHHTVTDLTDLVKMHAERKSVELADVVVGGSAHLLRWMLRHGYKLPLQRTYVQPNVVVPPELPQGLQPRTAKNGRAVKVDEVVFFGRLEYRKGLHIFCDAIDEILRRGDKKPKKITFLGKYGDRIPTDPNITVAEYIETRTSHWPIKTEVITNRDQAGAIAYLLGGRRLAVMPSLIENSSLAVYETALFGIPFVASDRGGNPELVIKNHRDHVLCKPHPVPLSQKIEDALSQHGFLAKPSFDNAKNLKQWLNFHSKITSHQERTATYEVKDADAEGSHPADVALCLVIKNNEHAVDRTLDSLSETDRARCVVAAVDDGSQNKTTISWLDKAEERFRQQGWMLKREAPWGFAPALNQAAAAGTGDKLLFVSPGMRLNADAVRALADAMDRGQADAIVPFHELETQAQSGGQSTRVRQFPIASDYSSGFFWDGPETRFMMVRRSVFEELEALREDYANSGSLDELLSRLRLHNKTVFAYPESLGAFDLVDEQSFGWNHLARRYRNIVPYIEAAPQCYSTILMAARGLSHIGEKASPPSFSGKFHADGRGAADKLVRPSPHHVPDLINGLNNHPGLFRLMQKIFRYELGLIRGFFHIQYAAVRAVFRVLR